MIEAISESSRAEGVILPCLAALVSMMLIRYQDAFVGILGATQYGLIPELENRSPDDPDLRRIQAVCDFALDVRSITGRELGRQDGYH